MRDIIAVFRSRSETLLFSNILKSYGTLVSIINTPRKANVSCGISARFSSEELEKARDVLKRRSFSTFGGFFFIIPSPNTREINVVPV